MQTTKPKSAPHDLEVVPRRVAESVDVADDIGIQEVFRHLVNDPHRTAQITAEIERAFGEGRKVLALTERTDHLEAIRVALGDRVQNLYVLHGRMSKKQRAKLVEEMQALPHDAPRVLLATGRLVGEGFDHPPLDTLVLAMPMLRSTVTGSETELARTPRSFGRGAVVFGLRHDGLWEHVDVLVISHGVSAGALLARLRESRIGAVDLVIVASGGKPQVAVLRAVRHRVHVAMAVSAAGVGAPPGLRWKRALPGLTIRAGAVTVVVVEVRDRRVEIAVN